MGQPNESCSSSLLHTLVLPPVRKKSRTHLTKKTLLLATIASLSVGALCMIKAAAAPTTIMMGKRMISVHRSGRVAKSLLQRKRSLGAILGIISMGGGFGVTTVSQRRRRWSAAAAAALHTAAHTSEREEGEGGSIINQTTAEQRLVPIGGRVAIIGAGAAGLSAAKSFLELASSVEGKQRDDDDDANVVKVDVFEQSSRIGGTWVYTEEVGEQEHSSMYLNLRTNIPKEVMPFIGVPFDPTLPSYMTHEQVLGYLEDFAKKYDIMRHIKFSSRVVRLSRINEENNHTFSPPSDGNKGEGGGGGEGNNDHPKNDQGRWEVIWRDNLGQERKDRYHAVLICNGHYTVPSVPEIGGLDGFTGDCIHAHNYRRPDAFQDKRVAVVGAGPSGVDISLEIASKAKKVYRAQKDVTQPTEGERGIIKMPPISSIHPNGKRVFFGGGLQMNGGETTGEISSSSSSCCSSSEEELDAIVFCTGYDYRFPFLDDDVGVCVEGRAVTPLYRHMYYTKDPSLVFIGLPWKVAPFPLFDCQTRHAAKSLTGAIQLPDKKKMEEERLRDEKRRFEELKLPHRYYHQFGDMQWDYNQQLSLEANGGSLFQDYDIDTMRSIYKDAGDARRADAQSYRDCNYTALGSGKFNVVRAVKKNEHRDDAASVKTEGIPKPTMKK